jgi:hypothetical protein
VSERTGGVPLFVEEVTRLLLERGEQGGAQAIPPTLQQSLAARLDGLGSARETAQIGAGLGRGFSYALLRSVAGLDEGALQSSLDRLAEADLLFVEGAPPQANYRFKHALIQDAAYESLLRSRRQELHRRAAEILRNQPLPLIADLRFDGLALRVLNDELGDLPEGWDRLGGLLGGSLCLDRVNPAGDELPRRHRPVASIPEADRWINAQTFVLPDAIDLIPQYQFLTSSLAHN